MNSSRILQFGFLFSATFFDGNFAFEGVRIIRLKVKTFFSGRNLPLLTFFYLLHPNTNTTCATLEKSFQKYQNCIEFLNCILIPPCLVLKISKKKCWVPVPGSSSSIFIIVGAHFLSMPMIMLESSQRMSPLKTFPCALTKWWWCSKRKCLKISFIGRVSEQSNSGHCTGL